MVKICMLNIKRILTNKIYWLSIMAALLLLICVVVDKDIENGKEYFFLELFYNPAAKSMLESGRISINNILLGYDTGYLWMFSPIIAGVPWVLLRRTERFAIFRTSKNKYIYSKYLTGILTSGMIFFMAYLAFTLICMVLVKENLWDMNLIKKLVSVFFWGLYSSIPSIVLSELVENKYLILCIPFVINYFMCMFLGNILPYEISSYISPYTYQILFMFESKKIVTCSVILFVLIIICGLMKKVLLERRCDCGQR